MIASILYVFFPAESAKSRQHDSVDIVGDADVKLGNLLLGPKCRSSLNMDLVRTKMMMMMITTITTTT